MKESRPRFARNKRELCRLIGVSHPTLYRALALPNAPRPRHDGRWPVAAIRKFVVTEAKKLQGPREKDRLQTELLTLRIQRATRELADYETAVRSKLEAEMKAHVVSAIQVWGYHVKRLKDELAPRFEALSGREIYELWTARENQVMREFAEDLKKQLKAFDAEELKVIPFKVNGNGATASVGVKSA